MNLVARAKGILLNPRQEWQAIDAEPLVLSELLTKYVLPLAAIGPIAALIGWSAFGGLGIFRPSMGALVGTAVVMFVLAVLGIFVLAWIVNALAPTFGGTQDMGQAIKLCAYSSTASWVAGIFQIIPALAILGAIGGLYTLYLFYIGLPAIMKAPPEKTTAYAVVVIIVAIVIYLVAGMISTRAMF